MLSVSGRPARLIALGDLSVSCLDVGSDAVLRYQGEDSGFSEAFVSSGSGGVDGPSVFNIIGEDHGDK